jgi:hypothetical protein
MRLTMTVPRWTPPRGSLLPRTARVEAEPGVIVAQKEFPALAREILTACGFTVEADSQYFPDARVAVDVIATSHRAISFYVVCKGGRNPSGQVTAAGNAMHSRASAAYKRAYSTAQALHAAGWGPVLLLTSHAPDTARARNLLTQIDPEVLFDVVNPLRDVRRLRWLARADERQLRHDLERRRRGQAGS